jgi:hypothetical protein
MPVATPQSVSNGETATPSALTTTEMSRVGPTGIGEGGTVAKPDAGGDGKDGKDSEEEEEEEKVVPWSTMWRYNTGTDKLLLCSGAIGGAATVRGGKVSPSLHSPVIVFPFDQLATSYATTPHPRAVCWSIGIVFAGCSAHSQGPSRPSTSTFRISKQSLPHLNQTFDIRP